MSITSGTKAHIRERAIREAKRLFVLFVYLALLLGSFTVYRRLVLAEYQITYLHYGYALIEALILAKVIMIGDVLHLGDRFRDRPLIIPTLYKTVVFSLLIFVFTALEDLAHGLFHHQSLDEIVRRAASGGLHERLAQTLVIFVALIPLFAYRELGRLLGEGKLNQMFVKPRSALTWPGSGT